MREAQLHADEAARLAALHKSRILDNADEGFFANIVHYLRNEFATGIASVAFIDATRQRLKAAVGLSNPSTPRCDAFCSITILSNEPLVVRDALEDPQFADLSPVKQSPYIRFYAGAPLIDRAGYRIGAVCVADSKPRTLRLCQIQKLQSYATMTMRHVELHALKNAHPFNLATWLHAQAEAARASGDRALSGYYVELIYALLDEQECGYTLVRANDQSNRTVH